MILLRVDVDNHYYLGYGGLFKHLVDRRIPATVYLKPSYTLKPLRDMFGQPGKVETNFHQYSPLKRLGSFGWRVLRLRDEHLLRCLLRGDIHWAHTREMLRHFEVGAHLLTTTPFGMALHKIDLETYLDKKIVTCSVHGDEMFYNAGREYAFVITAFKYSCTNYVPCEDICWNVDGHYVFFCQESDIRFWGGPTITDVEGVLTVHPANWVNFYKNDLTRILRNNDICSFDEWILTHKIPKRTFAQLLAKFKDGEKVYRRLKDETT